MLNIIINYAKLFCIYILRFVLHTFLIFPLKPNRIFFDSYNGRQYSCNPKYIFEYLYDKYGMEFNYIWCLNDPTLMPDMYKNIKIIKWNTILYIFYITTAKIYISNNTGLRIIIPKRKEQIVINTWHGGGAYKRIGMMEHEKHDFIISTFKKKITSNNISYFISSSKKFTDVMSESSLVDRKKFLPIGMPRNDILFNDDNNDLVSKVRNLINIPADVGIVLYAPTFRNDAFSEFNMQIDVQGIVDSLLKKYERNFVFMFRSHYLMNFISGTSNIINVTSYQDMQELLCVSDVLITDYSSSIWDFSFTYKPCFIYAPDLSEYKSAGGFYTPIEEWPFPIAEINEALISNILSFSNEEYIKKIKKHHEDLGSYENGTATKQICNLIVKQSRE
jgi:CDP-glycerol glycerophosphotransferase